MTNKFLVSSLLAILIFFPAFSNGESMLNYCHRFVEAKNNDVWKIENPVIEIKIVEHSFILNLMNSLGNLVSPSHSQINYGFQCEFSINDSTGDVTILLIENQEFAEYTKWEGTQIIEIGETVYKNKKYFMVFKYLNYDPIE